MARMAADGGSAVLLVKFWFVWITWQRDNQTEARSGEQSDLKGPVDLLKTSWWRMCYWSTVWLFYCITISKWFLLFVHITSSSPAPDWANVDPLNTIGPCCGLTSLSLSAEDSRESHSSRRWTLPDGTSLRLNHCLQKTHIKTHIFLIWLISLSPDELAG